MKRLFIHLSISALAIAAAACGNKGPDIVAGSETSAVAAKIAGDEKKADLGVTVTKPDGWYELSQTEKDAMYDVGADVVAGDDSTFKARTAAAKPKSRNLFTFFKHPLGAPVDFNPSVTAATEDVSLAPGVKNGADYFFHMRKILENGGLASRVTQEPEPYSIDGQSFHRAELETTMMGKLLHQAIFMTRHGDDVVLIIQHWMTEEDKRETQGIIDSIKLDW